MGYEITLESYIFEYEILKIVIHWSCKSHNLTILRSFRDPKEFFQLNATSNILL
jgi:hypothetical protein